MMCVPVCLQRYFLSRARRVCTRGGDQVPPNIQWLLHPEGHSFFVHSKPVDTSSSSILSSSGSKGQIYVPTQDLECFCVGFCCCLTLI